MCLTEQGYIDRMWGNLPTLGRLVGGKRPKDHWYGPSTASDNVFESMSRLMEVYAVVVDSRKELTSTNNESEEKNFVKDLENLASMLRHAAGIYQNAADEIKTLQLQIAGERHSKNNFTASEL